MIEVSLSLKNIFNTKQTYDLKKSNTNVTYNNPSYHLQKQLTFIDILLAEKFQKSQEMMVTCAEIRFLLVIENSAVSEKLIEDLKIQLNTFDKVDLPVVQYIKKTISSEKFKHDQKNRNTLIDLGYIDRAVSEARDVFNKVNNQRTRLSLSRELQYAS